MAANKLNHKLAKSLEPGKEASEKRPTGLSTDLKDGLKVIYMKGHEFNWIRLWNHLKSRAFTRTIEQLFSN